MRFSWVALSFLLATITGDLRANSTPLAPDAPPSDAGTQYARSLMALPSVAMPSTVGNTQLARLGLQRHVRPEHPVKTEDLAISGGRPAREARVWIRSIDRTGFEFLPGLTRAINGFLSSSTTVCPPPSS